MAPLARPAAAAGSRVVYSVSVLSAGCVLARSPNYKASDAAEEALLLCLGRASSAMHILVFQHTALL